MFVVLLAALYVTTSFGNEHNISSGVQSLVTVGSAMVLFIFNKLLSRTRVSEIDDKGLHLIEIIKRVSNEYSELWKIEDCTISITETDSENEADVQADVLLVHHTNKVTFHVNKSMCKIYNKDTNCEETGECCANSDETGQNCENAV